LNISYRQSYEQVTWLTYSVGSGRAGH